MRTLLIAKLLVVISVFSCQNEKFEKKETINGTWQSIGSGWVLQIEDSTNYQIKDITSISCLPNRSGNFDEIKNSLTFKEDTLYLRTGVIHYKFIRSSMPGQCEEIITNNYQDVLYNFEVFAETIKEHYAFFELNELDWNTLYVQQKNKLSASSTQVDLYRVMEETLELLNDNHAYLEAPDSVYTAIEHTQEAAVQSEENTTEGLPEYGDFQVAKIVANHHLIEDMTQDSWLLHWGKLTDSIGFIQVKAMWLHADFSISDSLIEKVGYVDAYVATRHAEFSPETYAQLEVKGINKTMIRVMQDLSGMKAIVLDIRFNGGGQDAVSIAILNQFAQEKTQIATQKMRYGDHFSPSLRLHLEGSPAAYTKPVYVLTSQQTASAADVFALASMAMHNVYRIGTNTAGALSTELSKSLPNGWHFSISNEIYMDNNGVSYENIGIPPDYPLYYPKDRQTFFRSVANDLESDKKNILNAIEGIGAVELSKVGRNDSTSN